MWKPCVNQAALVMVTQVDRTMVYSPELEGLQLGGLQGYLAILEQVRFNM